jgi:hypothetical protein
VFDGGITLDLDEAALAPVEASGEDRAVVAASGTAYALVFDRTSIIRALAKKSLPSYGGESVHMPTLERLAVEPSITAQEAWEADTLEVGVSGEGRFVWRVDPELVRKEISGVAVGDFSTIVTIVPGVADATASNRPSWMRTFPDPQRIDVVVNEEGATVVPSAI